MNAEIAVSFIRVELIIYLWLYNLHDCTFNKYYLQFLPNVKTPLKKALPHPNSLAY